MESAVVGGQEDKMNWKTHACPVSIYYTISSRLYLAQCASAKRATTLSWKLLQSYWEEKTSDFHEDEDATSHHLLWLGSPV